jgi:transposase/transcriptional regulator with XRE-family HTH domain
MTLEIGKIEITIQSGMIMHVIKTMASPERSARGSANRTRSEKPFESNVGAYLATARAELGESQLTFARRVGVDPPVISLIENGYIVHLGPGTVNKIVNGLAALPEGHPAAEGAINYLVRQKLSPAQRRELDPLFVPYDANSELSRSVSSDPPSIEKQVSDKGPDTIKPRAEESKKLAVKQAPPEDPLLQREPNAETPAQRPKVERISSKQYAANLLQVRQLWSTMSNVEIAAHLGVSIYMVDNYAAHLRRQGVPLEDKRKNNGNKPDPEVARRRAFVEANMGMSDEDLAAALGVGIGAVKHYRIEVREALGIKADPNPEATKRRAQERELLAAGFSGLEVAKILDVPHNTVYTGIAKLPKEEREALGIKRVTRRPTEEDWKRRAAAVAKVGLPAGLAAERLQVPAERLALPEQPDELLCEADQQEPSGAFELDAPAVNDTFAFDHARPDIDGYATTVVTFVGHDNEVTDMFSREGQDDDRESSTYDRE